MPDGPKRAVVLVSGGLDSATALAIARRDGFETFALSFDYGQRHSYELEAARRVARAAHVRRHLVFKLDLRAIGGSSLTSDLPVPKDRPESEMTAGIPITYVPARNTIFLSVALGWGETLGAFDIYLGVNAIDYSGYPDCRPEYIAAFERLANLGDESRSGRDRVVEDPHALDPHDKGRDHQNGDRARRRLFPDAQLLRSRRRGAGRAAGATRALCD